MQRLLLIALGISAASCGGSQAVVVDAPAIVIDAPGSPTLTVIASPATVARGETVTFSVSVTNFTIVDPTSGAPVKDGEGHFHYYLDDAVNYTAGWTPTVAFRTSAAQAPGPHTLRFVLANGAHQELTPTVATTANFTVQ